MWVVKKGRVVVAGDFEKLSSLNMAELLRERYRIKLVFENLSGLA